MLARIQPRRHRIALLSIPRDLYVEIPGHGHDRINMAFEYGGERLLTRVVRDTLGVEIDHFVEVDFHGFKDIVDDLGGVWFPVDQRYYNRNVGTLATNYANIDLEPGYQKLDGDQALAFARYRHDDSDFVRAARQQLLLRTVARDALGDTWNLFRVRRLAFAVAKATTSDISSLGEVLSLARAIHETPASHIVRETVQASDLVLSGADYVAASPAQLRATVRAWEGVPARAARRSPRPAVRAAAAAAAPALGADGGRGRALLASVRNGIRTCAPTKLPPGFTWPNGAARSYPIAGHPAIALYATAGSGDSVLWMYTTWQAPPILDEPSVTLRRAGRTLDVYTAGGHIQQVAWRVGSTRVWVTNTLRGTLTNAQMLGLATSCR
jgi:LCP family protein required for cell wall assembly